MVTFYEAGELGDELRRNGLPLYHIGKAGRWDTIRFTIKLVRLIRRLRPDVVHSYLTVPNIVATLIWPFIGKSPIVWGVRSSNMDLDKFDWFARWTAVLERSLRNLPQLIICNSVAGYASMVSRGFPANRIRVIFNGIDTQRFSRDSQARQVIRSEWAIPDDCKLVGIVARYDPMKGHDVLLKAFSQVVRKVQDVRLVCVGVGDPEDVPLLVLQAQRLGIQASTMFLPMRPDPERVYNALDVLVSASLSEGFSNSIAEAMACEVPCVVTDVGDAAVLLGGCGRLIPAGDADAMADGIIEALAETGVDGRSALSVRGRQRVVDRFSIEALVSNTASCLDSALPDYQHRLDGG